MPNHVHGIIMIEKSMKIHEPNETHATQQSNEPSSNFAPQSKNTASIIRGIKIGVTKYAVNNNLPFEWQARYYDHIIRHENDLNPIRKYIINNPSNWKMDEYTNVRSAPSVSVKDE